MITAILLAVVALITYFLLQKFYRQKMTEIKYQENKRVKQKLLVMLNGDKKAVSELLNNAYKKNAEKEKTDI